MVGEVGKVRGVVQGEVRGNEQGKLGIEVRAN